jgi:P4 family phage/plasmid primase-like protien
MTSNFINQLQNVSNNFEFTWTMPTEMVERMKKLASIPYDNFVEHIWGEWDEAFDKEKWYNNPREWHDRFVKWVKTMSTSTDRRVLETFKFGRQRQNGRIYNKGSFGFQTLHKVIRDYLFYDTGFYDIDMSNCHWAIVRQLIKEHDDILPADKFPMTMRYCEERSKCLADWGVDKKQVCRMLNKDIFGERENKYLRAFHKELVDGGLKTNLNNLYQDIIGKTTNEQNPTSSKFDTLLCFIENSILQFVMAKFGGACIPYFDGYISNKLIDVNELNEATAQWGIKWAIKPFDRELFDKIDDIIDTRVHDELPNDPLTQARRYFDMLKTASDDDYAEMYSTKENCKDFVYDHDSQLWYEYDEHNLIHQSKKPPLRLGKDITKTLRQELKTHWTTLVGGLDPSGAEYKTCNSLYKENFRKFAAHSVKDKIIKELKYHVNDISFKDNIDTKDYLLGFKNGMLRDFKNGDFRKIEKRDFVMRHINYNLPEKNQVIQDELRKCLWSMFEDDHMYHYLLDSVAYALFTNRFESFYVWTGCGGNGKSLVIDLIQKCLGEYFYMTKQTFLTGSNGNNFDSDLVNSKGRKVVFCSEPAGGSSFNQEKLLYISGRDPITTRDVGGGNISFVPTFTPFLVCNNIPKSEKVGQQFLRRMRVLNFPLAFKDADKIKFPTDRLVDKSIKVKFQHNKNYAQQFLLMLMEKVEGKYDDEIYTPPSVLIATEEYMESQNLVKEFMDDYYWVQDAKEEENCVSERALYEDFKSVFPDEFVKFQVFKDNLKANGYLKKVKTKRVLVNGKRVPRKMRGIFGITKKTYTNDDKTDEGSDDDSDNDSIL